jgi:hypothetical protein
MIGSITNDQAYDDFVYLVIPPLLERLVKSLNFDAGSMLIEVLEYCHEVAFLLA